MSDTPEGNICKVSANLGWASDTLAEVDKALLKLSAEVKTILRERDEWKAKFIQANKDYGFELRDPCGTIWDHAKRLQAERDEALKRVKDCGSHMIQVCKELEAGEMDCAIDAAITVMGRLKQSEKESERLKNFADNVHAELLEARKENEEQARLLGSSGSREARLTAERDHYKSALEEISTSVDDWLNSLIQEPSLDFIHAIKAYAQKKLNEIA